MFLEEQCFKTYFGVNICDKEKADQFVKIFGKVNGSSFQLDKKAKRDKRERELRTTEVYSRNY